MSHIYPKAPPLPPAVVPLDDDTIAARVVEQREADENVSKEQCVGTVLQGKGTVADFYRVWNEVEEERLAMEAVPVTDYETKTAYKTGLSEVRVRLDVQKFADGVLARAKVSTWAALLTKLKSVESKQERTIG